MATKNITVTGSMNTSADLAALVAGGDISITGQGTTTSSFQGLILAEGSFKAKDTTLIGSALTLDKNGSVQLERVRTVAARDLTKIDLSYAVELKKAVNTNTSSSGSGGSGGINPTVVRAGSSQLELSPENYSSLQTFAETLAKEGKTDQIEIGILSGGKFIKITDPEFAKLDSASLKAYNSKAPNWSDYINEVLNNSVVYVNVFQLDFNKFLKTKGGLRPLLQRVSAL